MWIGDAIPYPAYVMRQSIHPLLVLVYILHLHLYTYYHHTH